ncbi:Crp/Fnr family transcriptional regulator [Listeria booriae]|uniref:Crp/Fnr family transcriptional regulator n=1 Tax=Listeria booriae TaxID=1552123 RepID=UPI001629B0A6|nr:Crp/Fnr family transcriptional regulator [Listeria booriae]MBC1560166.1 Crp/Fnr family transcriptional regulator [Listeria booriae]
MYKTVDSCNEEWGKHMLLRNQDTMKLKKGSIIHECGEYAILNGYVVCKTGDHLLKIMKQGTFTITEEHFFGKLIQYQAQAELHVERLPMLSATDFLQKQAKAQSEMMHNLTRQLDLYALPVKERVMALLYRIACEIGEFRYAECRIPAVLTQVEVANYAHCTREYLNGIRKALIADQWLAPEKNWVLLDWDRWGEFIFHIEKKR